MTLQATKAVSGDEIIKLSGPRTKKFVLGLPFACLESLLKYFKRAKSIALVQSNESIMSVLLCKQSLNQILKKVPSACKLQQL